MSSDIKTVQEILQLPTNQRPLLIDDVLCERVEEYLSEQPYKVAKPVLSAISLVRGEDGKTFYMVPRSATLTLLNDIMAKERLVQTYMHMRQGYEQLLQADQKAAAEAAASAASAASGTSKKERKIVDVTDEVVSKKEDESVSTGDLDNISDE